MRPRGIDFAIWKGNESNCERLEKGVCGSKLRIRFQQCAEWNSLRKWKSILARDELSDLIARLRYASMLPTCNEIVHKLNFVGKTSNSITIALRFIGSWNFELLKYLLGHFFVTPRCVILLADDCDNLLTSVQPICWREIPFSTKEPSGSRNSKNNSSPKLERWSEGLFSYPINPFVCCHDMFVPN